MSEHDVPPLARDVRALLDDTRGVAAAPVGAAARVLARVEGIVLPPWPGGGGGGPGGGTGVGTGGGAAASSGSMGASTASARASVIGRLLPLAATFLLGAAAGVGVMWLRATPAAPVVVERPPVIVYVERPAVAPAPAEVPAPAKLVVAAPPPPAAPSVQVDESLSAERAILDVARHAIEQEDGDAALAATREHERRFPNGLLAQEREAMTVRALLLQGRRDEARVRTDHFRARFPGSVLTPALEGQVGAPSPSSTP